MIMPKPSYCTKPDSGEICKYYEMGNPDECNVCIHKIFASGYIFDPSSLSAEDFAPGKAAQDFAQEFIEGVLRRAYPHGHKDFIPLMLRHIKLHNDKNHDYAHGGHPLGNFTRVAAILKQYPGLDPGDPAVVAVIYLLKQLDAALWLKAKGHEAKVQGANERWDDISVYSNIIQLIEGEEDENH